MKLASLLSLTLLTGTAAAAPTLHETVVHDTTTSVEITLDDTTVLCSAADYGALFLKILIPELAGLTLLDHQNTGAGAPCVASGLCAPGNQPSDVIDPAYPTATADINVKAVRIDEADAEAQTCTTMLREEVAVTIRGIAFTHVRFASLGSRPFSDCATPPPAPAPVTDDDKTDAPGTANREHGGGCSAGGSGGLGVLVLGLGAVLARRRRLSARR